MSEFAGCELRLAVSEEPSAALALDCEFIADPARLEELAKPWQQLWACSADATPFQSPDWIIPWCKY